MNCDRIQVAANNCSLFVNNYGVEQIQFVCGSNCGQSMVLFVATITKVMLFVQLYEGLFLYVIWRQ